MLRELISGRPYNTMTLLKLQEKAFSLHEQFGADFNGLKPV
jgi:hypothetical protein